MPRRTASGKRLVFRRTIRGCEFILSWRANLTKRLRLSRTIVTIKQIQQDLTPPGCRRIRPKWNAPVVEQPNFLTP